MALWGYEYDAPVFGNLGAMASHLGSGDSYFDIKAAEYDQADQAQPQNIKIKQEIQTPGPNMLKKTQTDVKIQIKKEVMTPHQNYHRRRSMSVHIMEEINIKVNKHAGKTSSRDNLNGKLDSKFKRPETASQTLEKSSSVHSLQSNQGSKFISMAEAIYHKQHDTPERFRSRPKNQAIPIPNNKLKQLQVTVPQSPALLSKTRMRPVHVLSQKEIEDLELEELKKHKIKANPVPEAVLQGIANLPPVQRRPKTRPEPFNLTEMKKKVIEMSEKKFKFTARPVPKNVLNKPLEVVKKAIPPTVPISPKITKRTRSMENLSKSIDSLAKNAKLPFQIVRRLETTMKHSGSVGHTGVPLSAKHTPVPCKPVPFSFDTRDKDREKRKEQMMKRILEEEKKLREFHAKPIPSCVLKSKPVRAVLPLPKFDKKENKENCVNGAAFKARPPRVLHQEPFIPHRSNKPKVEPLPIELTTDKRARERDAFNQKVKEKEEQLALMRKAREEEERELHEKEIAELRSQLVHKAAPVRHYAPINIQSSELPLTLPKSPKFMHKH